MSRINKRAKRVLLGIDAYEKAKTSAALMFLKGFGYDQCEEDATKGSNPLWVRPMRRGCCEATIQVKILPIHFK